MKRSFNGINSATLVFLALLSSRLAADPPSGPSKEEQYRLVEEAKSDTLKRTQRKDAEYYGILELRLLELKRHYFGPAEGTVPRRAPTDRSEYSVMRQRVQQAAARAATIRADDTWQRNWERWQALANDGALRVVGGESVPPGRFPDCVAIGTGTGFCCSGTLIGKNVVVTAAHCVFGECADRVFIGGDFNHPEAGRLVKVRRRNGELCAIAHSEYNSVTFEHDIALLILEETVENVAPCQIASKDEIDNAFYLRLAGFGFTDFQRTMVGVKSQVDVLVASCDCNSTRDQRRYGCNPSTEIVAGGNGHDSCNGDSGGPAYVIVDGIAKLAGATSRPTRNSLQACGDGGVYTRVDYYVKKGTPLYAEAMSRGAKFE